jgi:hypothetical protein
MSGYTRNEYISDPVLLLVGTVLLEPDMFRAAPKPRTWTDPFIVPPVGYEPEKFDVTELGATHWYILEDGYGTPEAAGWQYEYRFKDRLQALLYSLLLRARGVPHQLARLPEAGRPDWPTILTDVGRLERPAAPTDAPFTGHDFEYLFESQARVDPQE